ncbi:MAG: cytochrome b/b6 domain-containing protein [Pseudomonadota bacterium]|nr:cytochrome b/b6 domain-containing protein [Pseudomonadota bacterium]
MIDDATDAKALPAKDKPVNRHLQIDICFHWLSAFSVLVLLGTGFLPIIGIKFAWVMGHWISGVLLTLLVAAHIVRAFLWQDLRSMLFGIKDIKEIKAVTARTLNIRNGELIKPGKYSPPQKLMHHGISAIILVTIVTGMLMMVKIDTPWWQRDLYWLSAESWGLVYVAHGFAALFLLSVVMIHIYFALRPEKRMYLRSMVFGRISRQEFFNQHDPERWIVENKEQLDGE